MTLAQGGNTFSNYAGNAINTFNLLGFPAIVESHYAIGGSFNVSDRASVDMALTYAPESTQTLAGMPDTTHGANTTVTTKHSQTGVSAQLNYDF